MPYASKEKKRLYDVAYRAANLEKQTAQSAAYYAANAEAINAKHAAYYEANVEKIAARQKTFRAENAEKIKADAAEYRAANPEQAKAWRAANREKSRADRRMKYYGVSPEAFQVMMARQSGLCDICGTKFSHKTRSTAPAVDHDHKTGEIRGLLCGICNSAIGLLKDNIDILERASDYLKQFRKNN